VAQRALSASRRSRERWDAVVGSDMGSVLGSDMEWPRCAVAAVPPTFEGDLERVPLLMGESCSVIDDIKPAAQIVEDLVRDAEASLAGRKRRASEL
jgi:hypothetical protein